MNVQNVRMVINFFSWSSQKYFEGTIFLNIDPKATAWYEEAKRVLIQKGYINDSYQYEKREYDYGVETLLLVAEYEPEVELRPLWVEGDILTNE